MKKHNGKQIKTFAAKKELHAILWRDSSFLFHDVSSFISQRLAVP